MKKWLFVLLLIIPSFLFGSTQQSLAPRPPNGGGVRTIPNPGLYNPQLVLERNRWVAAILAFPLPLGIMGAHRIFLGTKPVVPVVYVITLGGGVGIVPMIDFFAILFSKDISMYEENGKVLMWVK